MSERDPIFVTRPALPPLEEVLPALEKIWSSRFLTNGGPYEKEFKLALAGYLGVEHVTLVANATLGLILALRAADIRGEVITTPFTFIATAHAIAWNKLRPVFVDIDGDTFNLDPSRVEEAITDQTQAILPVHSHGGCCDVEAIADIADRHELRTIYDSAHAFGVTYKGASALRYGDYSIVSFHATKLFTTFEGGAVISSSVEDRRTVDRLIDNGIADEVTVADVGLNAKMNEFCAAVGVVQLAHVAERIEQRRKVHDRYDQALENLPGIRLPKTLGGVERNYSYYPILVGPEYKWSRDELHARMREEGIFARRYFFPLVSAQAIYSNCRGASRENLPVASMVADRVLCLPIYGDLSQQQQETIVSLIKG